MQKVCLFACRHTKDTKWKSIRSGTALFLQNANGYRLNVPCYQESFVDFMMAPKLGVYLNKDLTPNNNPINFPTPESDSISLSDVEIWTNSEDGDSEEDISIDWNIPLQNDLRDLLLKVTATENLETITQLKLKVITREISLQQLNIYTPALRELILDGSYVSSLRDLGCGLKNLKILRLNRCSLHHFDSVSSLENLEEIYASDNDLTDISSCAFLPRMRVIDVKRNKIISMRSIFFLSLCPELQHLNLEGNAVTLIPNFSEKVIATLPFLLFLDGITLDATRFRRGIESELNIEPANQAHNNEKEDNEDTREPRSFFIQFPPRVLNDKPGSSKM
ncbi:hypothetical protein WA026_009798 [Henosepilachna vigintioctopunctata]|uniref:Uncharacterized protein n=1 Tax=Henosepilachna vigintioctopunctata TaxID=420089 RepID=A0AAW1TLA2_9CUCU